MVHRVHGSTPVTRLRASGENAIGTNAFERIHKQRPSDNCHIMIVRLRVVARRGSLGAKAARLHWFSTERRSRRPCKSHTSTSFFGDTSSAVRPSLDKLPSHP